MTLDSKVLIGALAAVWLTAPSTVMAQDMPGPEDLEVDEADPEISDADPEDDDTDSDAESDEDEREWSVGGGIRTMIGQGTFVSPTNDTDYAGEVDSGAGAFDRVMMNFSVSGDYTWNDIAFDAGIGFTQALTPGGGGGTRPYEGRLQDLELGVGYAGEDGLEIGDTGIRVSPSFGMSLPTSTSSRTMTLLTSLSGGVGISKRFFGKLGLSYRIGGSRAFHRYTSPVMQEDDIQDDEFSSRLFRPDGSEDLGAGRFAVGRVNTQWGMSHTLSAQVMFSPKVMAMANYSISTNWSYPVTEDDEYASELQCTGYCAGQMSMGMIMVNYVMSENVMIMGGLTTTQSPKTADNKTFNFPFWNFDRPAANSSMLTIGVNGSY